MTGWQACHQDITGGEGVGCVSHLNSGDNQSVVSVRQQSEIASHCLTLWAGGVVVTAVLIVINVINIFHLFSQTFSFI